MATQPIEAVIFDFDGVLVRSIELHALAYQSVLSPLGVKITQHDVMVREGARSETIIRELAERDGVHLGDGKVRSLSLLKQQVFERIGEPQVYAWSKPVVSELEARGFPLAIVTGTRKENVPGIAPELVDHFRHLITQGSYAQDKPHPEPYLTAAKALDLAPASCLVVENAPRGVASAKGAGMPVVAITSTLPAEDLSEADRIIEDLHEVLELVPTVPSRPAEL